MDRREGWVGGWVCGSIEGCIVTGGVQKREGHSYILVA